MGRRPACEGSPSRATRPDASSRPMPGASPTGSTRWGEASRRRRGRATTTAAGRPPTRALPPPEPERLALGAESGESAAPPIAPQPCVGSRAATGRRRRSPPSGSDIPTADIRPSTLMSERAHRRRRRRRGRGGERGARRSSGATFPSCRRPSRRPSGHRRRRRSEVPPAATRGRPTPASRRRRRASPTTYLPGRRLRAAPPPPPPAGARGARRAACSDARRHRDRCCSASVAVRAAGRGEQGADEGATVGGDPRPHLVGQPGRRRGDGGGGERRAGEQEVADAAHRPHVGALGVAVAVAAAAARAHLGRHVPGRAARRREEVALAEDARVAEVAQLDVPRVGAARRRRLARRRRDAEHVLGLDVAVDDAQRVEALDRRKLAHDRHRLGLGELRAHAMWSISSPPSAGSERMSSHLPSRRWPR